MKINFSILYQNYRKCRKGKRFKKEASLFEFCLEKELLVLEKELRSRKWQPQKAKRFIVLEPKPREIIAAAFKDRIVHHLIHSQINPSFEKRFVYDSYANRKNKGTHKAINRLKQYLRKITKNYTQTTYYLKADIKSYFATVNHKILFEIIEEKITDKKLLSLIKTIIENRTPGLENFQPSLSDPSYEKSLFRQPIGQGMPIGNLTSQLFANIYLDKLDHFIKEKLKAKFYLRYLDDFLILDTSSKRLKSHLKRINDFLKKKLKQELHPRKTTIQPVSYGIDFLGYYFKNQTIYVRYGNVKRFKYRLIKLAKLYSENKISSEKIKKSINAWYAYARHANSYNLRKHLYQEHMKAFHSFLVSKEDYKYFDIREEYKD